MRHIPERRLTPRHTGCGLVAHIVGMGEALEVRDISIGGLRLIVARDFETWPGQSFEIRLHSQLWPDLAPVWTRVEVRAAAADWVALQYVQPSFELIKLISHHATDLFACSDSNVF